MFRVKGSRGGGCGVPGFAAAAAAAAAAAGARAFLTCFLPTRFIVE